MSIAIFVFGAVVGFVAGVVTVIIVAVNSAA